MKIHFTQAAWKKQCSLIGHFDTEVAWHGLVRPIDGGYEIYDILVYPQKVTGGTVETDQVQYQTWLMQQPDEIFSTIRYQGHSHVNMQPFPSSVDLNNQRRMQVPDNDFYIFMIWNKEFYYTARIYDHGKLIEQNNVDLSYDEDVDQDFIEEVNSMITIDKPTIHYSTPFYEDDEDWQGINWYERWQEIQREALQKRRKRGGRK